MSGKRIGDSTNQFLFQTPSTSCACLGFGGPKYGRLCVACSVHEDSGPCFLLLTGHRFNATLASLLERCITVESAGYLSNCRTCDLRLFYQKNTNLYTIIYWEPPILEDLASRCGTNTCCSTPPWAVFSSLVVVAHAMLRSTMLKHPWIRKQA